jgi:sugar lactone lactonase YvrE
VTPVAGSETTGFGGDNGPATSALLSQPSDTVVDSLGNIYIADGPNNRVRKVSNGVITTVAGTGPVGFLNTEFSGDNGPATSARLSDPNGVALDSRGNLYIADSGNGRVRLVSNGIITTVAGGINGGSVFGSGGDNGPAVGAELIFPTAIALDSAGNLFIADRDRCCVRKVSNGIITTVAGNIVVLPGFSGDNSLATNAQLYGPTGVAVDATGNLYIADTATSASARSRTEPSRPSREMDLAGSAATAVRH